VSESRKVYSPRKGRGMSSEQGSLSTVPIAQKYQCLGLDGYLQYAEAREGDLGGN
jgi:hypothetical protein